MVSRKRNRFVLGSNKYRHKPVSLKLIKQVQRLQKEVEKKYGLKPKSVSFVWITDNLDVRLKK